MRNLYEEKFEAGKKEAGYVYARLIFVVLMSIAIGAGVVIAALIAILSLPGIVGFAVGSGVAAIPYIGSIVTLGFDQMFGIYIDLPFVFAALAYPVCAITYIKMKFEVRR
jgi:hypothetical protein